MSASRWSDKSGRCASHGIDKGVRTLALRYGHIDKAWRISIQHPHFQLQRKIVKSYGTNADHYLWKCYVYAYHVQFIRLSLKHKHILIFVIWPVFAVVGGEMPFVWSIDEVVVSGKTSGRFKSVHCSNAPLLLQYFIVLNMNDKTNTLT